MRVFYDDICTRRGGVPDDPLVERMVPDGGGRHTDTTIANRGRQLVQVLLVAADDLLPRFF